LFPPVRNAHVVRNGEKKKKENSFALEFGGCLTMVRMISKLSWSLNQGHFSLTVTRV